MKKKAKKKTKRCRHTWGAWEQDGPDKFQVCKDCGACRFKGDRYAYTSRWKKPA